MRALCYVDGRSRIRLVIYSIGYVTHVVGIQFFIFSLIHLKYNFCEYYIPTRHQKKKKKNKLPHSKFDTWPRGDKSSRYTGAALSRILIGYRLQPPGSGSTPRSRSSAIIVPDMYIYERIHVQIVNHGRVRDPAPRGSNVTCRSAHVTESYALEWVYFRSLVGGNVFSQESSFSDPWKLSEVWWARNLME